jgi:hypothetical protein
LKVECARYISIYIRKLHVQARLRGDLEEYERLAKGTQAAIEGVNAANGVKYSHQKALEEGKSENHIKI